MTASSVTGIGQGGVRDKSNHELTTIVNTNGIIFSGYAESEVISSPPSPSNHVTFPYSLSGGASEYVVLLTGINTGYTHVTDRDEDDDGNFTGFSFGSESIGSVMYLVAKVGIQ